MPRLPDYTSLDTVTPQSNRPIVGYNGGQVGEAVANVGAGMAKTGQSIMDQQDKVGTAYATSHLLNTAISAQKQAEMEADPAKATEMYNAAKAKALQEASAMIPGGQAREMFLASSGDHTRYMDSAFEQNIVNKKAIIAIGSAQEAAQNNLTQAINSPDEAMAAALISNTNDIYHTLSLTAPTKFTPLDAQNARNQWVSTYVKTKVQSLLENNVDSANQFYARNRDKLPGQEQFEIEKMLHSQTMQQTGLTNATALLAGDHPPPGGSPTAQAARSATVEAAKSAGVDENAALTVLRIESSDGQNLGTRGDIGQTGKGGDLPMQASNLVTELKKSQAVATDALGRQPEPWEQYLCYQQGAAGGPALLKADPNAKAVDVLSGFYKDRATAASAITNNGGNATMTVQQFCDSIKQKYDANAQRATIAPPAENATDKPPPPLQPGANPMQTFINLEKIYPDALQRANAIPNLQEREATLKSLEQQHSIYQASATAWKTQFQNQAQNLAMDPKFTSTDQIPADMRMGLADSPLTMQYLEARANYNLEHSSGAVTKDMREYGQGFYDLFKAIHAPADDPNRISDVTQLYSHVGPKGDLTMAGLDKLTKEMSGKGTPEGESEAAMRTQNFKVIKNQLSGEDMYPGMKDPKGEEIYAHALPLLYKALDDGKAKGLPFSELYDPKSKNWIGNAVQGLKRDPSQWYSDMAASNIPDAPKAETTDKQGLWYNFTHPFSSPDDTHVATKLTEDLKAGKLTGDSGKEAILNALSAKKISRQTAADLLVTHGYARPAGASATPEVPRPE